MTLPIKKFLTEDAGAISVDWVVLSAAAVGMAISATAVIQGGLYEVASDLEAQLRSQQISDAFVSLKMSHFEQAIADGLISEEALAEYGQELFDEVNAKTNAQILASLEATIEGILNGTITDEELAYGYAVASVAYQRNIVDDAVIHAYFGDEDGNYAGNPFPGGTDGDGDDTVSYTNS